MNQKTFIRIGFILFLFAIGYLAGAGFGKTVKYLAVKEKKVAKGAFQFNHLNNFLTHS